MQRPKKALVNASQLLERLQYRGPEGSGALFADALTRERTIGINDLLNINYLKRGYLAARSIGRITVNTSDGRGYGTGFLVGDNIVLTNKHVRIQRLLQEIVTSSSIIRKIKISDRKML